MTTLEHAIRYHELGFCLIPIKGKAPAVRTLKPYFTYRSVLAQLQIWFAKEKFSLGVVLGKVSGELACRDFDDEQVYREWTLREPELAAILPTVSTRRGAHVYFRCPGIVTNKQIHGELRGECSYCVLPPSIHPKTGMPYTWLNEMTLERLLKVDPFKVGLAVEPREQYRATLHTNLFMALCNNGHITLEWIINRCLPKTVHANHNALWDLRRGCDTFERQEGRTLSLDEKIALLFTPWFERNLYRDPKQTRAQYLREFLDQFTNPVNTPLNGGPISIAIHNALAMPLTELPGVESQELRCDPELLVAASLCRELQRYNGDKPFPLATSKLGEIMKTNRMDAWRILTTLAQCGVIKLVKKGAWEVVLDGVRKKRIASTFEYLPPIPALCNNSSGDAARSSLCNTAFEPDASITKPESKPPKGNADESDRK